MPQLIDPEVQRMLAAWIIGSTGWFFGAVVVAVLGWKFLDAWGKKG